MNYPHPYRPCPSADRASLASPPHVLYVDDDPLNIALMQAMFESRVPGCRLSVAASGYQALSLAPLLPPTLLLMMYWPVTGS